MNILGLTTSHSSSAALLVDGSLVGMIQEERFTKRKNQVALPLRAADALVESHLGGDPRKIDQVVFGGRWDSPYWVALDHYSKFSVADHVQEMHDFWHLYFYGDGVDADKYWRAEIKAERHLNSGHNLDFSFLDEMEGEEAKNEIERARATEEWLGVETPCKMIDHHKAHAYWALYGASAPAEMADMLVMTADAMGNTSNWSVSTPDAGGSLKLLGHGLDHDVARVYKFVTLILGMKPNEHEYKVMGLSSYSCSRPPHRRCGTNPFRCPGLPRWKIRQRATTEGSIFRFAGSLGRAQVRQHRCWTADLVFSNYPELDPALDKK